MGSGPPGFFGRGIVKAGVLNTYAPMCSFQPILLSNELKSGEDGCRLARLLHRQSGIAAAPNTRSRLRRTMTMIFEAKRIPLVSKVHFPRSRLQVVCNGCPALRREVDCRSCISGLDPEPLTASPNAPSLHLQRDAWDTSEDTVTISDGMTEIHNN